MIQGEYIKNICDQLSVPKEQIRLAEKRRDAIGRRLTKDFAIENDVDCFFVGSYVRNTAIDMSDEDVMAILPWHVFEQYDAHVHNGQSMLLQAIKKSLLTLWPKSNIHADGQIVYIQYADGIRFEIVPAFPFEDKGYRTLNTHNGGYWTYSDPKADQIVLKNLDAKHNNACRRLARLMRAWKIANKVELSGWEIDTYVCKFFREKNSREWRWEDYYKLLLVGGI